MKTRALTPDEISSLPDSFTQSFDIARVRLIGRTHNPFARGKILALHYELYWKNYPEDFTALCPSMRSLLMHELCHVWQYETGRLSVWRYLSQPKNWAYGYHYDTSKTFDDYPTEKQADLLQDWYLMNCGNPPYRHHRASRAPSLAQINAAVPFEFSSGESSAGEPASDKSSGDELIV